MNTLTEHAGRAHDLVKARHLRDPEQLEIELQLIDILCEVAEIEQLQKRPAAALAKYRESLDHLTALAKAGRLDSRPVYGVERRKQIEGAIAALKDADPPK